MESCAFFILCLTNESHEPYQYRLLYNNEHYDESLLSSEFTDRANPDKFLDSEEKQNWKPKLRNPNRKFTKKVLVELGEFYSPRRNLGLSHKYQFFFYLDYI